MLGASTRVTAMAAVCLASCSSGGDLSPRHVSGTFEQGGNTGAGAGAGGDMGASGSPLIVVAPTSYEGGLAPDAACSGEVHEGERVPLDM